MGKPGSGHALSPRSEYIGPGREPRELKHLSNARKRKQTVSPLVAASETGSAQTLAVLKPGGVAAGGSWDPPDRAPAWSGSYKIGG